VTVAIDLIQRVLAQMGAADPPSSRLIAGDPSQAVTGVATVGQATLQALQQAAAAKANLVFSYDPVFWTTGDDLARLETDALFLEKREFIRAHDMVVFTLRDQLHDSRPDLMAAGMAESLGWRADGTDPNLFRLRPTSLLGLARELGAKLESKTMRVVGDPATRVSTVATSLGNTTQSAGLARLNQPIDVLIGGYAREWEAVEYAQDMISAGLKKGLILLGENASVQPAMRHCAGWMKGFITEVPVSFIALPEPYWNP
jgi:putative NIF3 family GTP cyclohydrolase 1 type 2